MTAPSPVSDPNPAAENEHRQARPLLPAFGDAIDFSELLQTLRKNAWRIIFIASLTFLAVACWTLFSTMKFVSSGRLYLGDLTESAPLSKGEIDLNGASRGDVTSEIEILRSRSLITDAIVESGLNVVLEPTKEPKLRYHQWLLSGRDPRLLDAAWRKVRVTGARSLEPRREALKYTLRFSDQGRYALLSGHTVVANGELGTELLAPTLRMTLLPGEDGPPASGAEFSFQLQPLDKVVEHTLKELQISAPNTPGAREPVKVVTLTFSDDSPRRAADFLSRLMGGYLEQNQAWKTEHASVAEAFVTEQLDKLQDSLDDVEEELADYRRNNEGVVLDDEAEGMIAQLGRVEDQRVAAQLEVASLTEVMRYLDTPDPPIESFMLGEATDRVLEDLAGSLSEARRELSNLEARFHEAAPEVRHQRAEVDALLASIKNYVSGRLSRSRKNLGTLNGIVAGFEKKLKSVPGAEIRLERLSRKSEVYSTIHSYLLERKQQAAIVKASHVSKNRILDAPDVPVRESSPRLTLRLASAPLGILLGIFVVLGMRVFGGCFQSEGDIRRAIGTLPVFAKVPRRKQNRRTRAPAVIEDPRGGEQTPAFVESFRALRANLYRASAKKRGTTVLLTSPNEGDGKTTCVLALASMLAADQQRVLVIDANVRRPTCGRVLSEGRSSLLPASGVPSWLDGRLRVPISSATFSVLFSTEAATPEDLSNGHFGYFIEKMTADYDYVLLDSPPYPLVTDALVLSGLVDVCLSVLRVGNSDRRLAIEHLKSLSRESNDCTLGVVINDAQSIGVGGLAPLDARVRSPATGRKSPSFARKKWSRIFA